MDLTHKRNFTTIVEKHFEAIEMSDRRTGTEIRTICPFCHGGSSEEASFDINLDKGVTRCWRSSCGYSGSAAWFLKDFLNISYPEAMEILEGDGTASIPELQANLAYMERKLEEKYSSDNDGLLGETIESYIPGSKMVHELEMFDDVEAWLERRGFNPVEFLEQHVLHGAPHLERYRDRVLFEVTTLDHIAYLAYAIHPTVQPKTLNPKGDVLSRMLYNYNDAMDGDVIFVCEGVFDVARLKSWGLDAVAIFGVAMSAEQVYLLSKTSAKEICVMLDHGTEKASIRLLQLLSQYILNKDITMVTIEKEGADPDDLKYEELELYFSKRKQWANSEMDKVFNQVAKLTARLS